jgi:excisionase family DNA binding protein
MTKRKQLEYMRPSEAAKALGVTRNTIMSRIAKGLYRGITVGGMTFVARADVEAAIEAPTDMAA